MTAPALAPYRPLTAAEKGRGRRWLPKLRAALHPDEFPGVTERHAVDQALAATDRKER